MIPKRIIYCWFGENDMSEMDRQCIASWKKMCPSYEVVEINESNFDVDITEFCRECYDNKNYAFVADYARLWALKHYGGGFYLDTDIELFHALDGLRKYSAIVPLNEKGFYNCAPLACDQFPEIFEKALYELQNGKCLVSLLNAVCHKKYNLLGKELEIHDGIAFLGKKYFINNSDTKDYKTIGIHYGNASWLDKWQGSYEKSKTFVPFEIYQNGNRDHAKERKFYGNEKPIGVLMTEGRPFNFSLVLYGNYFYNPNVQKIVGNGFEMQRYKVEDATEIIHQEEVDIYIHSS